MDDNLEQFLKGLSQLCSQHGFRFNDDVKIVEMEGTIQYTSVPTVKFHGATDTCGPFLKRVEND